MRVTAIEDHAIHGMAWHTMRSSQSTRPRPPASAVANFAPKAAPTPIDFVAVSEFLLHRQAVTQFLRDALQAAVNQQKKNADRRGRKNTSSFL
ncbi:hypothetical protein PF003_g10921 [Phytophthora fragariae]|nr:hypothetical protein PF003_g10921 [Phytophthora fragariae]